MIEAFERRTHFDAAFSASVNFQPLNAPRAPGMLTDYGGAYAVRRGGLKYGWSSDLTADAVDRNVTKVQKNDTFISIPKGQEWDMHVPNGTYDVYVVAGDPAHAGSRMALSVEGQTAVAGITRRRKMFLEGKVTVAVTDGKLTIAGAGEFNADKINYVGIQAAGTDVSGGDSSGGGTEAGVPTAKIKWTAGPRELTARTEPESATVDGKFYVFSGYGDKSGGVDGWEPSKTFDRYDPATNTWTQVGQMPVPTTHAAITVVGHDIWFAGGYTLRASDPNKQDVTSTNVWIYHTLTNTWEQGPALPARRGSGGMALVNNKLYFVSGEPQDHHSDVTDVWVHDLARPASGWTSVAPIPQGRTHFGIAVVNDVIYVIGGQLNIDANATFLKTAYSYDPATNKWKRLADLPSIRSHLSPNTFVVNGKIISIGGEWKFNHELNEVIEYDPATNKFTELTPIPAERAAGAATYLNGRLIFTGGKNNAFFSDTWIGKFV